MKTIRQILAAYRVNETLTIQEAEKAILDLLIVGGSTNKGNDELSELRIEQLEEKVKLLSFMLENGLGYGDMLNDITPTNEIG